MVAARNFTQKYALIINNKCRVKQQTSVTRQHICRRDCWQFENANSVINLPFGYWGTEVPQNRVKMNDDILRLQITFPIHGAEGHFERQQELLSQTTLEYVFCCLYLTHSFLRRQLTYFSSFPTTFFNVSFLITV